MSVLEIINSLIVSIGIPAIVAALIFIGRKLEVLDALKQEMDHNIRPDLKDVRERFATLEGRTAGLFDSHSPISLTDSGENYLKESGLKDYIDANKEQLMEVCDHNQKMRTPYDVQQAAFDFFSDHDFPSDFEAQVKTYAYEHGTSMDAMRRIAGIYFRDLALADHGFKTDQLD